MQPIELQILDLTATPETKRKGFQLLVETYSEKLYWHLRRFVHFHDDADDLLQDVFIKVWQKIDTFQGKSSLYTWLYRIATNEALGFIRKNKRMQFVEIENDQGESVLEQQLKADPLFDGEEAERKLSAAIDQLPEKQKTVFLLRYYEEMKYDEISKVLDTSVGALKANYHHAVKKIEESLTQKAI